MSLKDRIIEGLDNLFEAKIQSHVMNIEVLLSKPVGVAEHPDIMATVSYTHLTLPTILLV